MKKIMALLLALALMLSAACAEGLPYLIQGAPTNLNPTLTLESYPEIYLGTWEYPDKAFGEDAPAEQSFVVFPSLNGTPVEHFEESKASYWYDHVNYLYSVKISVTPADFLHNIAQFKIVINEPEAGVYAYLDTNKAHACGYIALPQMGPDVSLNVDVDCHSIARQAATAQKTETLKGLILSEMERLRSVLHVEHLPVWWSWGKFAGVNMLLTGTDSDYVQINIPSNASLGFPPKRARPGDQQNRTRVQCGGRLFCCAARHVCGFSAAVRHIKQIGRSAEWLRVL